jgi:hypothetical protein
MAGKIAIRAIKDLSCMLLLVDIALCFVAMFA